MVWCVGTIIGPLLVNKGRSSAGGDIVGSQGEHWL